MTVFLRTCFAGFVLLLAACSSGPPVPDWQMEAHGASDRAVQAWLKGDDKVAASEWTRAREQVARTGRPDLMARLALLQCAAAVASLQWDACAPLDALRADADPQDGAYADYLAGRLAPAQVPLLPEAQRAAAGNVAAIAAIDSPLSRLVAAGAALRAGRATPQVLKVAVDTASEQGWRRPLLAWLLLSKERAQATGDEAQVQALARRIAIVQGAR